MLNCTRKLNREVCYMTHTMGYQSEEELLGLVGNFHPGERFTITFRCECGVTELERLGSLAELGHIEIEPKHTPPISWSNPVSRQSTFEVLLPFAWQNFWEVLNIACIERIDACI